MTYEKITAGLLKGPRLKSQATKELEELVCLFLNASSSIVCQFNHLNELEVKTKNKTFNVTQILKHQPDFEHLSFDQQLLQQYVTFIQTARHTPSLGGAPQIPSKRDYEKVDPDKKYQTISYPEKLAITLYTSDPFYQSINLFLRTHGKENESYANLNESDLIQFVKEVILTACIASHGISALFTDDHSENDAIELLYREEKSHSIPQSILEERIAHSRAKTTVPLRHEGFTSSSQTSKAVMGMHDIRLEIRQSGKNSIGKDVQAIAYKPNEKESLFLPGVQFVYTGVKTEKDNDRVKIFEAVPVRSLNNIDPFSYSPLDQSIRCQLIELKKNFPHDHMPVKKNPSGLTSIANKFIKTEQQQFSILSDKLDKMIADFEHSGKYTGYHKMKILSDYYDEILKFNKKMSGSSVVFDSQMVVVAKKTKQLLMQYELGRQSSLIKHADYVYEKYLSRPYTETDIDPTDHQILIDGETIHRPNHGLAHSLRAATYIPYVIDYLKQHSNPELKKYYAKISPKEVEKMQLCMLFSVTGRESEVGFSRHPEKYSEYKKKSVAAFTAYAKQIKMNAREIQKYSRLIRNLGNPHFSTTAQSPELIAAFHCMDLAHDLDLMRCYQYLSYKAAIEASSKRSVVLSDTQQEDLLQLFKMVSERIRSTGDRQYCGFKDGQLLPLNIPYTNEFFVEASRSPKQCLRLCLLPGIEKHSDVSATEMKVPIAKSPVSQDIDFEAIEQYFIPVLNHLNSHLGHIGIEPLDALTKDSYLIQKITQEGNNFNIVAESPYSDSESVNIILSSEQLSDIISSIDPVHLPLIFDSESIVQFINYYKNDLGIQSLDKLESSDYVQKITPSDNADQYTLLVQSAHEGYPDFEVILSKDQLSEIVQVQMNGFNRMGPI